MSVEKRMLTENDEIVADCMKVMDKKNNWLKNVDVRIAYRETEMQDLIAKFKLNERDFIRHGNVRNHS